jgi:hypothetical protein
MYRVDKASTFRARLAAAALAACGCVGVQAQQPLAADYSLTTPSLLLSQPDAYAHAPVGFWGPLRFSAGGSSSGNGLSLEAGQNWFARAGVGHGVEGDAFTMGGGFRFTPNDALSMMVTRQLGQERLGLAVHYDWRQAYMRLSYDQPVIRTPGIAPAFSDRLRFSAGVRF